MPAIKRIFAAIKAEIPLHLQSDFDVLKNQFSGEKVRWVPLENMHITLCFFGNANSEQISVVARALHKIASATHSQILSINGLGVFPSMAKPKVLFLNVLDTGILRAINSELNTVAGCTGFIQENKKFNPHITLGRMKYLANKKAFKEIVEAKTSGFQFNLDVERITLFESVLTKGAPVYYVISEEKLNTPGT